MLAFRATFWISQDAGQASQVTVLEVDQWCFDVFIAKFLLFLSHFAKKFVSVI